MKNILRIFSVTMLFLAPMSVFADRDNGLYLGLKTGVLEPDTDSVNNIDDDNPIGVVLGYDWSGFAIQGEYYSAENDYSGGTIETDVLGVYGVFRTDGFIYFMGKAGIVQGDSKVTGLGSEDDTALGYGLGLGLNLGDTFEVEAEYLIYEIQDVDVDFFGVTAYLKF